MIAPDADPKKIFVPGEVNEAHFQYLDNPAFAPYKEASYRQLGLKPGDIVLDAGCGTGIDTFAMASMAAKVGRIIGVDRADPMIVEARRRRALEHYDLDGEVSFVRADLTDLDEFESDSFDVARIDRTLQHAGAKERDDTAPARILAELARVVRPGGTIQACEPDWGAARIDAGVVAEATGRKISNAFVETRRIYHPRIGIQLAALFRQVRINPTHRMRYIIACRTLAEAEAIFRFQENAADFTNTGDKYSITAREAAVWLAALEAASKSGEFYASLPIHVVTGQVPLET
ncbi:hypothetical protein A3F34_00945 [Candidatus Roizmanbacteria bacterium RIFCSPHIGHO2_12_FULL_44_10]|uniref:Methyltransferase domain-containing protein n=1 Tax=Candidatus Roizmanbacteria bacterium RIFCSPHIGHO2_12_FULL_44_10 TaxID=1802054 RepID=A0A1F7I7N6_9BACT|nr:MAG: hypothetical protein A3F34_00945 [Candidatus Roizmanbacteria bacterium RIFCSPHIGHO2_12_FULL_44_10]